MSAAFTLKATPGPWSEDGPIIYTGINQRTGKIAEVSLAYKDSETYAANVRLIAAAPELYEALSELLVAVRYADPPKDYGDDGNHGQNLCHEARIPTDFVTIAERALARARGDS